MSTSISDDAIYAIVYFQRNTGSPDHEIESILGMQPGRLKKIRELPTVVTSIELSKIQSFIGTLQPYSLFRFFSDNPKATISCHDQVSSTSHHVLIVEMILRNFESTGHRLDLSLHLTVLLQL